MIVRVDQAGNQPLVRRVDDAVTLGNRNLLTRPDALDLSALNQNHGVVNHGILAVHRDHLAGADRQANRDRRLIRGACGNSRVRREARSDNHNTQVPTMVLTNHSTSSPPMMTR